MSIKLQGAWQINPEFKGQKLQFIPIIIAKVREIYDRQFHVQIKTKMGFGDNWLARPAKLRQASPEYLLKKTPEKSPATDSRTQTSFQTFHTVFPVILDSPKKLKKNHPNLHLTSQWRNTFTDQSTPFLEFQLSNQNPLFRSRCRDLESANLTFFFFSWAPHTHTHIDSLLYFPWRINFTALSSLSPEAVR